MNIDERRAEKLKDTITSASGACSNLIQELNEIQVLIAPDSTLNKAIQKMIDHVVTGQHVLDNYPKTVISEPIPQKPHARVYKTLYHLPGGGAQAEPIEASSIEAAKAKWKKKHRAERLPKGFQIWR